MYILLRTKGLRPTQHLLEHVHRRLAFALARFGTRISAVRVLLADENGPRGGVDKRCRVVVDLPHRGRVRIEESGADTVPVVDIAADRAARTVQRLLNRLHDQRRRRARGLPRPGSA